MIAPYWCCCNPPPPGVACGTLCAPDTVDSLIVTIAGVVKAPDAHCIQNQGCGVQEVFFIERTGEVNGTYLLPNYQSSLQSCCFMANLGGEFSCTFQGNPNCGQGCLPDGPYQYCGPTSPIATASAIVADLNVFNGLVNVGLSVWGGVHQIRNFCCPGFPGSTRDRRTRSGVNVPALAPITVAAFCGGQALTGSLTIANFCPLNCADNIVNHWNCGPQTITVTVTRG